MSERKVILGMVMSLDGLATSLGGTHEWMFEWFDDDSTERNLRALGEAGVHAMGRRSYEIMGPHWTASEGPIATAMNDKPRPPLPHAREGGVGAGRGLRRCGRGHRGPEGPRRRRHNPVHGGPTLAASLTRLGLVDEFQLSTVPIAIGAGRSPFADLQQHLKLEVVDEQRFRSGVLAQVLVPKQ
jgi:dihydrofolate reductase